MPLSKSELLDVLIVGAGPAGNTTSIACAREGLKVLQIEGEALPRRKICGGGLSHKTLQALPISIDPVIERWIDSVWVSVGPGNTVLRSLDKPGAMVCRERLDAFMAEAARSAGALLMDGCRFLGFQREPDGLLQVATSQGSFRTRILVGADGVHSPVRRQLFPETRLLKVPAIEALLRPDPAVMEAMGSRALVDFLGIEGGYGWIFPKQDHLNVGVYRLRKSPGNTDLKQALRGFIDATPLLAHAQIGEFRGYEIPIRAAGRRLVSGQVMLVGDAAGVGEAFYGEGIYFAVASGQKAGACIAEHLLHHRPLEAYSGEMRGLRRDLAASRLTARLFYRLPGFAIRRMIRSPFVADLFEKALAGSISPWHCLLATSACAPWWALQRRSPLSPIEL